MATDADKRVLEAEGIDFDKLSTRSHHRMFSMSFSNNAMLVLYRLAKFSPGLLREWLYHLAGAQDVGTDLLPPYFLLRRMRKLKIDLQELGKDKLREDRVKLLKGKFELPLLRVSAFPVVGIILAAASAVSGAAVVVAEKEIEVATSSSVAAQSNLNAQNLQAHLGKAKRKIHNTQRQAKRAKLSNSLLLNSYNTLLNKHKSFVKITSSTKLLLSSLRLKLRREQRRKCTVCPKRNELVAQQQQSILELRSSIAKLREELRDSEMLLSELADTLTESAKISTKSGSAYTENMQLCMMQLTALNVSQGKVGQVINTVLTCLVSKQLDSLPSRRTVGRSSLVSLSLSQQQIAASVPSSSSATLCSDETTKGPTKINTYVAVCDDGEQFVLGLRETVDKASRSQLNCLKQVLSDIGDSTAGISMERIVVAIKNLMSDRAATQVKFNSLFEAWRKDCVAVRSDWPQLTVVEREKLCSVNWFFCNLHLLANLADRMIDCMALLETTHGGKEMKDPALCSVVSLIRVVAKFFSSRSAARWGIYSKWIDFLSMKGEKFVPSLPSFLGHRFNILFLLAARIFEIRLLLIEFCEEYEPGNEHLIHVVDRLRDPFVVAQLKVLGLLDKLVTGPLWRLCESDIHILDMSGQFVVLLNWLGANVSEPSAFLNGIAPDFAAAALKTGADVCLDCLTQDSDDAISQYLPIIAKQVLLTSHRYFEMTVKEFLPGGRFSEELSGPLRDETKSVPKTNRLSESVFGLTDWLLRRAPNMTMLATEALVLVIKNKTFAWFDSLTAQQKQTEFRLAKGRVRYLQMTFRSRKSAMAEERCTRLKAAKTEAVRRRMEAVTVRSDLTKEVTTYGLWTNEIEVDLGLGILHKSAEKVKALKAQLKFRKTVLKQPGERSLFLFSENRKDHSLERLRNNLICLIDAAMRIVPAADSFQIIGKKINHRFQENGKERWWPGTVTRTAPGTGRGGNTVYLIVYDTDKSKEYSVTAADLTVDIDNGDLIII